MAFFWIFLIFVPILLPMIRLSGLALSLILLIFRRRVFFGVALVVFGLLIFLNGVEIMQALRISSGDWQVREPLIPLWIGGNPFCCSGLDFVGWGALVIGFWSELGKSRGDPCSSKWTRR